MRNRNKQFAEALKAEHINLDRDYYELSAHEQIVVNNVRKSFHYSGKNGYGREPGRQFYYAAQKAQPDPTNQKNDTPSIKNSKPSFEALTSKELVTVTLVGTQSKIVSYGLQAVAFKVGRKEIARTEVDESGRWINCRNNFSFSNSESEETAIEIMKKHLEACLNPFDTKAIKFVTK